LVVTLVISIAHRWKRGKSARGSPRISAMTWTGKWNGRPVGGEVVEELVDDPLHEVALPSLEDLGAEGRRDERPVQPVLGLVHLEDGPSHDQAHDPLVDRRRVRLVVPEHLDRLVEPEDGDRRGPRGVDVGEAVAEVDGAQVDGVLAAELAHAWIRVADLPGHGVLQLEGVEPLQSRCRVDSVLSRSCHRRPLSRTGRGGPPPVVGHSDRRFVPAL